jgi:hypothetical protein
VPVVHKEGVKSMKSAFQAYIAETPVKFYYNSLSRTSVIRKIQTARGLDPCYLTEKRLLCGETTCEWRKGCRRLVAVWKR